MKHRLLWSALVCACLAPCATADSKDEKYPLDDPLRVLAEDIDSPRYRRLVLEEMLITDLAAEWQRVATADNPESFLAKHGGKERVLGDRDLKSAYERRVAIRDRFLQLMRDGYRKYKQVAPFDRGEQAELFGTLTRSRPDSKLTLAIVPPAAGADRYWPRFRGPTGQGETRAKNLPVRWDRKNGPIVWRSSLPGLGNSSPVIWGQRLFVTSATNDGNKRFLHCLDLGSGRILWTRQAPARPVEPGVRDKNGYASSTPVTDGTRVVAFLGSCGLLCYDFAGELLWHYEDMKFKTTHGTGTSPLIYRDLVIFVHDQNQNESVFLALDKEKGTVRWRQKRGRAMTWCSPIVVRVNGRDELVYAGGETVKGYDPLTGKELWSLTGPTQEVVPTVVVGKHMLYSASGRNGPTLGLRPGGDGDVTKTHLIWRTVRGGPHVPSPILVHNRLYTVNDMGIATCLDADTGKLIFQGRINDKFSASPVAAGDLMYFPGESGITYVLRAGTKLEIVARNDLGSPQLASPAVVNEQLILRTQDELICLGKS